MVESGSKLKGCLTLFTLFAVFFTVVPFIMGGGLTEFLFPFNERQLKMVLADARVTDILESRRYYTHCLDGNEAETYNFNTYVSANPALRKKMDDSMDYDDSDLAHYLRRGDLLTKAANSPLLTVRRGTITTHWILYSATPEGKVPTPERPFITHGDTAITP